MLDQTSVIIVVSIATLVTPIVFLALLAVAVVRRNRGLSTGPRLTALLAFLGASSLGLLALVGASDLVTDLPILAIAALYAFLRARSRHFAQAGWIVAGVALPWTLLWAFYAIDLALNPNAYDPGAVWAGLAVGAIPLAIGIALILRGDPPPSAADPSAAPGQPGSRAYGSISQAIGSPNLVGPFGVSDIGALVAFVAVWVVVPFLVPATLPRLATFLIPTILASAAATEAYIRVMPTPARRAFEAFSWLGEWELRQAHMSPLRVPRSPAAAARWLDHHPDTPELASMRTELLVLAGRIDAARSTVAAMPADSAQQRWDRAEARDSVEWRAGGDGDLAGLEAAAAELLPADGDDRLRAEVSIAAAKVRRRMADGRATPGDAAEPLIEVRNRLGSRADGQVGRALRGRLFVGFLLASLVFGLATQLLSGGSLG